MSTAVVKPEELLWLSSFISCLWSREQMERNRGNVLETYNAGIVWAEQRALASLHQQFPGLGPRAVKTLHEHSERLAGLHPQQADGSKLLEATGEQLAELEDWIGIENVEHRVAATVQQLHGHAAPAAGSELHCGVQQHASSVAPGTALAIGAEWPGLTGSFYAGIARAENDQPDGHLVLLPDSTKPLKWKAAVAWAEGLGDGARLPTRFESALLYANARDQFEFVWHWTGTEVDGSFAWGQYFGYGLQGFSHKSYEVRARAVRRFPLSPSVLQEGAK